MGRDYGIDQHLGRLAGVGRSALTLGFDTKVVEMSLDIGGQRVPVCQL
jgi:hypothetical protein